MKPTRLLFLLLIGLLLTACAPAPAAPTATPIDVNAIQTAVVQTVVAEVTQTAAAFTPTPSATFTPAAPSATPTPEVTATPTINICDNSSWVADASVPDNTVMTPGQAFEKTWRVKNTGSCTWTGAYTIRYGYGDRLGGQDTYISQEVLSNQEAEISLKLTAPTKPGTYRGYWRLYNNNGYAFGEYFSVIIIVQ
ncbi:MAG: hypothetical protein OHK0031_03390 [Anaerolineales bacterium]